VAPTDKKRILEAAGPFFERLRQRDGTLKRLIDRYYGHATRFSAVDSSTLLEQIAAQLPKLKPFFMEAELASGIDWRLVAAIGYQESHWDAKATSPTGVRGLMMLTEETADRLQIKDRLDARDSILGGARYFALLKEQLPPRLDEPDRTWLALAAYNVGIGHLEDARVLAQRANLNPDKWQDVRQVIAKLSEPESFQSLKHGYARGGEAMQLVDNIRNYYDVLSRLEPRDGPVMPGIADSGLLEISPPSGERCRSRLHGPARSVVGEHVIWAFVMAIGCATSSGMACTWRKNVASTPPCVTTTIVLPSWVLAMESIADTTRSWSWRRLSPPGITKSGSTLRMRAKAPG
jgi:soluble lytic murein transglycosylase-like protein